MTAAAQRIAALSPEQREVLLRALAKTRPGGRAPEAPLPRLVPRPEERFEPFPLTDVQQVYWAGRSGLFDLPTPGPGAAVYLEYDVPGDEGFGPAFESAFRRLFDRHDMLRAVMLPDGRQQVLRELPPWRVEQVDLRWRSQEEVEARIAEVRERFRYAAGKVGQWPLFGILAHVLDGGRVRLHAWLDAWLIDGLSRDNLVRDLLQILQDPNAELPPLDCTYRDYALAWEDLRKTDLYRRSRDYWLARVPGLPPPPELPLARVPRPETPVRFTARVDEILPAGEWTRLKAAAADRGLTPTAPLLAAFAEVLRAWSRSPRFTFGLDGTYWPPIHPGLREIVGNFNTVHLLAADDPSGTFAERALKLQEQLSEALDHCLFSGHRVLREVNRLRGPSPRALMPVLFNSLVEFSHPAHQSRNAPLAAAAAPAADGDGQPGSPTAAIEQIEISAYLPQVLLTAAVFEGEGGRLDGRFQAAEDFFPAGWCTSLQETYGNLVRRLANDETAWDEAAPLPEAPLVTAWSDPRERELAQLWGEVLGVEPAAATDDFFALGGDSFALARLQARLRESFGSEVELAAFFEKPTLGRMADLSRARPAAAAQPPPAAAPSAPTERAALWASIARRWTDWMEERSINRGMRNFLLIWFGQSVSAIGTGLGSFALGVWLFEKTHSATSFAMIGFIAGTIMLLATPVTGALADRVDRRKLLLLSDAGSGLTTLTMALLIFTGRLQPWGVYPIVALMVAFVAIQMPALTASITLLVPRSHLARASGMTQTSRALSLIIGPLAAAALVGRIGYYGVILIDCTTFFFAVGTLLLARIPLPAGMGQGARRSVLADLTFGWTYLRRLPGLFSLMNLYAVTNFCMGMVQTLLTPLILSFATAVELGTVSSAGAAGALLGGFALSVWGGPRRRVLAILRLLAFQALLLFLGGLQPSIPLITLASFAFMFTLPIAYGCNQVILQSKVEPGAQGRVFAVAGMVAAGSLPLASLLAGPLADRVFEPLLAPGGGLAGSVGRLIGVGPGRGVGFLFILLGAAALAVLALASLNPRLRRLESDIPDALPESGSAAGAPVSHYV
jgi:MFS family permease/aryl carrier-like protein